MLSIHLGDYPGSIYDTETYFRNSYLDSWFEDPMAAQIIKRWTDQSSSVPTTS